MEQWAQVVGRALGRMSLPFRGELLLLGCHFAPSRVPLRTYRGLVCISPALFGVPVIGHYPSYHPLARELRLEV